MIFDKIFKNKKEIDEIEYSDKDRIDNEIANSKIESKEIWRDVVNYERWYEVSDKGNVRRINRDGSTKLLKARPNPKGRTVGLRKLDVVHTHQISHLVAEAFKLMPTERNSTRIYHIDGDVNNDVLSNLTYDIKETEAYIKENANVIVDVKKDNTEPLEAIKPLIQINENKDEEQDVTLKDINNTLKEIVYLLQKHID